VLPLSRRDRQGIAPTSAHRLDLTETSVRVAACRLEEVAHETGQGCGEDVLFAAEVPVHRRSAHPCRGTDLVHPCAVGAARCE
jgi:hypothetical protein